MDLLGPAPVVVAPCRPIDSRTTADVRARLREHLADGDVVLDLGGVSWVDAVALRMLAATTRQAAHRGRRLAVRGGSPRLRSVLRRTPPGRLLVWDDDSATRIL